MVDLHEGRMDGGCAMLWHGQLYMRANNKVIETAGNFAKSTYGVYSVFLCVLCRQHLYFSTLHGQSCLAHFRRGARVWLGLS